MNTKTSIWIELDRLLRGDKTKLLLESASTEPLGLKPCLLGSVVLGVGYGLCMGLFAVMTRTPACWEQLIATAIKVPALFLFTLVVTFPSLYVFSALLGTRLKFLDVLRLLVAAITVNLCILAAFGPITAFFTISTTSYHFMKLLHVAFFGIAGGLGLAFLVRVLRLLDNSARSGLPLPTQPHPGAHQPPPIPVSSQSQAGNSAANRVLIIWLAVYALVGAQMGWVLRPFVGDPEQPFQVFRAREANIFIDIARSLGNLFQ